MTAEKAALEMRAINKVFNGTVRALKDVDLVVGRGEIHALLGENGAGKSTLMNILGGVVSGDTGMISRDGNPVEIHSSHDAREHRISFIHQELNLVPDLRVYENVFLGEEPTRFGVVDRATMIEETQRLMERLDIDVSPTAIVRELGATLKQVVEIAGAIRQSSDLIIMDEPTTSLTDHEIEHLFEIMRTLKREGVSLIFISHKLKEVFAVCDRYTVLRDGSVAGSGAVAETDVEGIVRMMVGRGLAAHDIYRPREIGEVVLHGEDLEIERIFHDVSFSVHRGEIVGFTGLAGDGRSELFEAVFGYRRLDGGALAVDGKAVRIRRPQEAAAHGIGYAPKNRKENAIVKDLRIVDNISLPSLKRFVSGVFVDRKREIESAERHGGSMNLRYNRITDSIMSLSGGNQQKVVLAKWLEADSDVIVLDNPTQGIDVGAKSEIYELLFHLAEQGKSVVVLSSEFAEITRICDRIYVMYHGEVVGVFDRDEADDETLMLYSTGVKQQNELNHASKR